MLEFQRLMCGAKVSKRTLPGSLARLQYLLSEGYCGCSTHSLVVKGLKHNTDLFKKNVLEQNVAIVQLLWQ